MGVLRPPQPVQTLYVTIRRDELRQLKEEREQLKRELTKLRALAQPQQIQG